MAGRKVWFWLALAFMSVGLLFACGAENTPTPAVQTAQVEIPTFTPAPLNPGTPTPSPIVVAATPTLPPTLAPTRPPTSVPTPTLPPTLAPTRPPTPTASNNGFRDITVEQARNLNGYRALLPAYLPTGFRLSHLSVSQTTQPRLIILLAEYDDEAGHTFYYNLQASPNVAPTATPTPFVVIGPAYTLAPTFTPRPTAPGLEFQQETVRVRGQMASLSYNQAEVSLRWSEGSTSYSINGAISRADVLQVAESLK